MKTARRYEPITVKSKPKGCKCNPAAWDGWFAVCDKYVRDRSHTDGRCLKCHHNEKCHTKPKKP